MLDGTGDFDSSCRITTATDLLSCANKIYAATISQAVVSYCSTQLLYFIGHETTSAINRNKTFILLQHLSYFIAQETTSEK